MKFCMHIYIDKIKPRDYQMSFVIGQGFAKVQILKKKVKLTLSLEPFGIFDKILDTH